MKTIQSWKINLPNKSKSLELEIFFFSFWIGNCWFFEPVQRGFLGITGAWRDFQMSCVLAVLTVDSSVVKIHSTSKERVWRGRKGTLLFHLPDLLSQLVESRLHHLRDQNKLSPEVLSRIVVFRLCRQEKHHVKGKILRRVGVEVYRQMNWLLPVISICFQFITQQSPAVSSQKRECRYSASFISADQ